jgi:hypothetical protein
MPRLHPRLIVATSTGLLAVTGCASGTDGVVPGGPSEGPPDGGGSVAACVAGLTYEGTFYIHVGSGPVTAGEALDDAEVPPCNDTGGGQGQATPIDAFTIVGVDPRYAVVAEGGAGQMTYVAEGYAPGLRDAEPLPEDVAGRLGIE